MLGLMTTSRLTTSSSRPRRDSPVSALRTARLAKGLSQAELAARAGLSPGWVSLLERTPEFLTERTARQISEVLGVPAEDLRS